MKERSLLPSVLLESTTEVYRSKVSRRSSIIYLTVCVSIVVIILLAYFTLIPISVKSAAIVRPSSEISAVSSLTNGQVKESFVKENLLVKKGDTLFVIDSKIQQERGKFLRIKRDDLILWISDLKKLLDRSTTGQLATPLYRQAQFNFQQKINDGTTRLIKVQADYNRNAKLHREKVIADAEFENFQYELDKTKNDHELVKQTQLSAWQTELRTYERELQDIEGQLSQLSKENENLIIKAPVSGSIQSMAGVYPGSMVFANQELAQISPDTTILVEAYLNPNDIGLIREGMPAKFQVNAFNYNQWGLATGTVKEISNDILMINDQPVFKVRCQLDRDYLQLRNGYKGYLKKGMTIQARFMVTERTLWQLLYDKADDWLNPNTFVNR